MHLHILKLNFQTLMNSATKELKKLRLIAEHSLNKTAELQQVLAKIEASLLRVETQNLLNKNTR